jgi:hypothetical protein
LWKFHFKEIFSMSNPTPKPTKPLTTNPAAVAAMDDQAQLPEILNGEGVRYLERIRRGCLSKYVILSPENRKGDIFLDELEKVHLLPATVSWFDENRWMHRLFIRPPGVLPQSFIIGSAEIRFITGSWKCPRFPDMSWWITASPPYPCQPARIPVSTVELIALCSDIVVRV